LVAILLFAVCWLDVLDYRRLEVVIGAVFESADHIEKKAGWSKSRLDSATMTDAADHDDGDLWVHLCFVQNIRPGFGTLLHFTIEHLRFGFCSIFLAEGLDIEIEYDEGHRSKHHKECHDKPEDLYKTNGGFVGGFGHFG
jgi:hypothetical protein